MITEQEVVGTLNALTGSWWPPGDDEPWDRIEDGTRIDWVICGGESGPHSRPFNLAWARSLRKQCEDGEVPFFMKQFGQAPVFTWTDDASAVGLTLGPNPVGTQDYPVRVSHHGGNPEEWPEDLQVRQFPARAQEEDDA